MQHKQKLSALTIQRERFSLCFDKEYVLAKRIGLEIDPKFIRLYLITKDFGDNLYGLELSSELKQQGIHDIFHLLLL